MQFHSIRHIQLSTILLEKLPKEHVPEIVMKKLYTLFYSVLTGESYKEIDNQGI